MGLLGLLSKPKVDSVENLRTEFDKLRNQALDEELELSFEGEYQIGRGPDFGPKFPFLITQTKTQQKKLSENCLEGMMYTPFFIDLDNTYGPTSRYEIKGNLSSSCVEFSKFNCLNTPKGFPSEFAKKIAKIYGEDEKGRKQKYLNSTRRLFMGFLEKDTQQFNGVFGDHYYNKGIFRMGGIFVLRKE